MSPHAFAASSEEILSRLDGRRRLMVERVKKLKSDGSELVTPREPFFICVESNFKCAVRGHSVYIHHPEKPRTPYWALTLDHINPLNQSKGNPAGWSGDNIQLLSSVLNSVKSDNCNEELIR
ncbi:hypothetical protein MFLAVUS_005127 [Mucor flavus]|uniref:HNH nuclease domain-containing protein n=1 Tax=Mucor flavus TaxID=439312 RepID=A0ABP9YXU9_9FUNG